MMRFNKEAFLYVRVSAELKKKALKRATEALLPLESWVIQVLEKELEKGNSSEIKPEQK